MPGRIALTDERAPEVRILVLGLESQLRVAQRVGARAAVEQAAIELRHQRLPLPVRHAPQAHDQRLRPRQHERPPQTEDTFPRPDVTHAGLAGREHHEVRRLQIEARDIRRGEQAVLGFQGRMSALEPGIGSGQREPGAEQRVLELRLRHASHTHPHRPDPRLTARIALLVGQEEAVGGEVQDARRAARLESRFERRPCQPGPHAK